MVDNEPMECVHNPRNSRTVPIEQLSLAERALLLTGASSWTTHAVPRAGIPAMTLSDGPHGLRREVDGGTADGTPRATGAVSEATSEAAGGAAPGDPAAASSLPATCFPTASVAACSWDPALAGRMGQALGEEARAQGVNVLLGPGLNVKRSPLCGRNFEYYAEDPLLAGRMAAGFVRGVQSQGVAACPKHFAANGQELRRQASDSVVDERTLRELYLTAFEIAVREGRPWALMSSYNLVNGTYAHENRHLLTGILRREWGFDGMVVSDWGASNSAVAAVAAGGSLEMPCPGLASVREIVAAVRSGRLSERDLNERAREVALCARRTTGSAAWPEHQESRRADQIYQSVQPAHGLVQLGPIMRFLASKTAVFSHDRSNLRLEAHRLDRLGHEELAERVGLTERAEYAAERAGSHGGLPAAMIDRHDDLAREVAEQAMVLLRNDRDILPLRAGTRIALIGDMAAHPRFQGSGSSKVNATRVTSLCEAIRAERGLELAGYAPGYRALPILVCKGRAVSFVV